MNKIFLSSKLNVQVFSFRSLLQVTLLYQPLASSFHLRLSNVSEHVNVHYFQLVFAINAETCDRCGIRTRATEVTGALNQRLRPLGQPAMIQREILERVLAIAKDNAKTGYYELFVLLPELALINGNKTLFTIC